MSVVSAVVSTTTALLILVTTGIPTVRTAAVFLSDSLEVESPRRLAESGGSASKSGDHQRRRQHQPQPERHRVQCGEWTCDLRTHYCDPVIEGCARCDDDCHPSRIGGNTVAIEECNKNCAVYYQLLTTRSNSVSTANMHTTTSPANADISRLQIGESLFSSSSSSLVIVLLLTITVSISCLALAASVTVIVQLCRHVRTPDDHCPATLQRRAAQEQRQVGGGSSQSLAKLGGPDEPGRKWFGSRQLSSPAAAGGTFVVFGFQKDVEAGSVSSLQPILTSSSSPASRSNV